MLDSTLSFHFHKKKIAKSSVLQKLKGWPQSQQNCFSRNKCQHPTEVCFFLFLGRYSDSAYLLVHDDSWWEVADASLSLPLQSKSLSTAPLKSSFPLWLDLQLHLLEAPRFFVIAQVGAQVLWLDLSESLLLWRKNMWIVPHIGILEDQLCGK